MTTRLHTRGKKIPGHTTEVAHPEGNVANTVVLREADNATQTIPDTFLRVFGRGEIPAYAKMQVGGVDVGQVYETARYSDGSLKHAACAVVLPFTPAQSKTITFVPTATAPSIAPESKANMLNNYNFDSVISLTVSGVTLTASARTMLTNDHYEVVFSGPVYTAIYLRDHIGGSYDMGWAAQSGRTPVRPCFYAEFWPSLGKCRVRAIVEIAKTTDVESVTGNILITAGSTSPVTVHSESSLGFRFGVRPNRFAWTGGAAPGHVNRTMNLDYLASVGAIFNYDTTMGPVDEAVLAAYYAEYNGWTKGLFTFSHNGTSNPEDQGWHVPFEDQGGNRNLGPFPTWHGIWLFSGDWRLRVVCDYLNMNLSSISAFHYRESAAKTFHGVTSGLGKPISIIGRPTIGLRFGNNMGQAQTAVGDRLTYYNEYAVDGTEIHGYVNYEDEHIPNNYGISYLLTADPFYLEELQFTASSDIAHDGAGFRNGGTYGGIYWTDPRRWATYGIQRVQAAHYSRAGSIEKVYFTEKLNELIAMVDGMLLLPNSLHVGETMYDWGVYSRTVPFDGFSGLCFGTNTSGVGSLHRVWNFRPYIDPALALGSEAPWMSAKVAYAAQMATEFGYNWTTLIKHIAKWAQGIVTHYPYPTHCRQVEMPTTNTLNAFFTTWAEVDAAFLFNEEFGSVDLEDRINLEHSYMVHLMLAAGFDTESADFAASRTWYDANVRAFALAAGWHNNPKWAIKPRPVGTVFLS